MKKTILFALAALAGFLVSGGAVGDGAAKFAGGGGANYTDFLRQQQIRLFSLIDGELSQRAERAIIRQFAAVKKAEVQLQSELGGRKANLGVNLIGSFAESESRAIGWQLRAFTEKDDSTGANAGIFYRKMRGDYLWGVNAFLDYEDGDYEDFSRVGIGGELRNKHFALNANYYNAGATERQIGANAIAFSRRGYDAKLRIAAPQFDALKLAADYYHFDGKRQIKDEKGFRYGVEITPLPALHVGIYHDSESKKFGGDIAYHFPLDENTPSFLRRQESITDFTPDMFAPVSREYGQRIATAANTDIVIATMRTTTTTTVAAVTTTAIITAVTTTMMVETPTTGAEISRVASVHFTSAVAIAGSHHRMTTLIKHLLTIPPSTAPRPYVLSLTANLFTGAEGADYHVRGGALDGFGGNFPNLVLAYTLTVVQGSEEVQSTLYTTTTLTTETTTTMAVEEFERETITPAMTITATLTTFSTMTVTPGANSAAMGDIPPMDSRLRGNDGRGGNDKMPPPNPPQMASADIPLSRHFAVIPAPDSRHSRAAGAGISQQKKGDSRATARE